MIACSLLENITRFPFFVINIQIKNLFLGAVQDVKFDYNSAPHTVDVSGGGTKTSEPKSLFFGLQDVTLETDLEPSRWKPDQLVKYKEQLHDDVTRRLPKLPHEKLFNLGAVDSSMTL